MSSWPDKIQVSSEWQLSLKWSHSVLTVTVTYLCVWRTGSHINKWMVGVPSGCVWAPVNRCNMFWIELPWRCKMKMLYHLKMLTERTNWLIQMFNHVSSPLWVWIWVSENKATWISFLPGRTNKDTHAHSNDMRFRTIEYQHRKAKDNDNAAWWRCRSNVRL